MDATMSDDKAADLEAVTNTEVAQPPEPQPEQDTSAVNRLSKLSPLEYARIRKAEAQCLGVDASALDKEVSRARKNGAASTSQGEIVLFNDPEPWPESVDGAALLDEMAVIFTRFLVLPEGAADTAALWVAHAHAYDAFLHSPRINPYSPEKGCGKTTFLDVLQAVTPKALRTENVTTAVLFRLIEAHAPTLLVDECDTFLKDNDELRGALNAGHRRGGVHLRCEGDDNKVKPFKTFAPVALAGIRELPSTLADRSIKIRMQRAKHGELRERFDARSAASLVELKRKAARWAADNLPTLERADPDMGNLFNRKADNWRPLFAIAETAGGDWPMKARKAVVRLSEADDGSEGVAVVLLEDIRTMFSKSERLPSAELCEALSQLKERPWPEWDHGKPINQQQVAKLLKPFGIKPGVIRIGQSTPRGYERGQFVEAFDRYLQGATAQQHSADAGFRDFEGATRGQDVADENKQKLHENKDCCGVADENPRPMRVRI